MSASTLQTLADQLAADVVAAMDETGQDRFYIEVGNVLGASSQSLEEAFLTAVRVRLAERNARRFLDARLAELRAKGAPEA